MSYLYYLNPLNHVLFPVKSLVTHTYGWLQGNNKTTTQKVYSGAVIAKDSAIIGYSVLTFCNPGVATLIGYHITSIISLTGWGLLKLLLAIFLV